jgi:hypothetical protein
LEILDRRRWSHYLVGFNIAVGDVVDMQVVKENINIALCFYLIQLIYPSLNIAAEDN